MDSAEEKAEQFITRLLANPALRGLAPLSREEQIQQFLKVNASQLYPTLSSPTFFPRSNWQQIVTLLHAALMRIIDRELQAQLQKIVEEIDFSFVSFLSEWSTSSESIGKTLLDFQLQLLRKSEARRALNGPLAALTYGFSDRYVEQAFRRREYIHFELFKVQRLRMGKDEIKEMVNASLLLRNAVHILTVDTPPGSEAFFVVQPEFAEKVLQMLQRQLENIPEPLLRSGVCSNVSFLENPKLQTTARLTSTFAFRCHNYRPILKVDRGADTPDKS